MNSLFAKRIFDVVLASVAMLLTLPLGAFACLAIKLDDGGPVLYRACRAGQHGNPFTMFKFRTMSQTGPSSSTGPAITVRDDPRITRAGRVLRASKIDELPQLANVLRGEMSLVGPRPEDPRYVASYTDRELKVLKVRPGITGPAAIAFRREEEILAAKDEPERAYRQEILPAKLALDLDYIANRSMVGDFRLIAQTILAIPNARRIGQRAEAGR